MTVCELVQPYHYPSNLDKKERHPIKAAQGPFHTSDVNSIYIFQNACSCVNTHLVVAAQYFQTAKHMTMEMVRSLVENLLVMGALVNKG